MRMPPNYWFVRTPWDSGSFPVNSVAGAAQPERYAADGATRQFFGNDRVKGDE
jgi:hypothetical protein